MKGTRSTLRRSTSAIFSARSASLAILAAGILGIASAGPPAQAASTASESGQRLPYSPGRWVPPAEAAARGVPPAFFARNGRDWIVYWDEALQTPRYVVPRSITPLAPSGASEPDLIAAARAFVERNRDFFGLSSADLVGPRVTPIARQRLVGFLQEHRGLTVRGAGLRILVESDGSIVSIDAFLARAQDLPNLPAPVWQDENLILQSARDRGGERLGSLDRQLLFPTASVGEAVAGYCLESRFAGVRSAEVFFRSSGEYLGETDAAMYFDGSAKVLGESPNPENIFATANDTDGTYPIPDARLYVVDAHGSVTGDNGVAEFNSPRPEVNLWPSLEMGILSADPEPCMNGVFIESDNEGKNLDGVKTIFRLFRADSPNNVAKKARAIDLYDPKAKFPVDPLGPIPFTFDESQIRKSDPNKEYTLRAFELLVYHSIHKLHIRAQFQIDRAGLQDAVRDLFPLSVFVPATSDTYWEPSYDYDSVDCDPRITISQERARTEWIPATIIQHEYAHHTIQTLAGTNQQGDLRSKDFVDGLGDTLVAFANENPRIGFLAEDYPGPKGYRVDDHDWLVANANLRRHVSAIFWEIHSQAPTDERREQLLRLPYVWLAQRQVEESHQLAFDDGVFLVQLLIADAALDNGGRIHRFPIDGQTILNSFSSEFSVPIFLHSFIRGDADGSGAVDLSDPINILNFLFLGGKESGCLDAMDVDDNGDIDVTDPIDLLAFLFLGSAPPAFPFPLCDLDPTDLDLWCAEPPAVCRGN